MSRTGGAGERLVTALGQALRLPPPHPVPGTSSTFAVASVSATLMLAAASALGVLVPVATGEFHFFQPSERPGTLGELIGPTNEHPHAAIAYFTLDSGFVIAFTMVFVGLYALTRHAAPQFARLALGAGIWTGIADAVENSIYWTYAMRASAGIALADFDTPLLPVLSNLKMVGFFATYLGFALILPRRDWLERMTSALMLLPPSLGLLSLGMPALGDVRPILLAGPSLPLILVFARVWLARRNANRTAGEPPSG